MGIEAAMVAGSRLVLCGDSVFLAGIKAELERLSALELITVEPGAADATDLIRSWNPCALLFDLTAEQSDFAITLLRQNPELLMIGVDPGSTELLLVSSRSARALSVTELFEIINEERGGNEMPG
ncbi:MAG: hypothetical protein RRC07_07005 [Anaerolineae bacterium]|nr:hypothetical protein [Anaerolineae bacterium]